MLGLNQLCGFGVGEDVAIRRYWRIKITQGQNGYIVFSECQLMIGGTDQVPTMSSATNGDITISDRRHLATFDPWKAFDNGGTAQADPQWTVDSITSDEWIKVDFGVLGKNITSYSITPRGTDGIDYAPVDFSLQWSADDTTWNIVNTQTGLTTGWTNEVARVFTV